MLDAPVDERNAPAVAALAPRGDPVVMDVLQAPHPMLESRCSLVERVDDELRALLAAMEVTMRAHNGLGLAANQIGVSLRALVMDVPDDSETGERGFCGAMINPTLTWTSDEIALQEEGCLSVEEYRDWVERPARCRVSYVALDGSPAEVELEGLAAACVQHEMDHLDGKLFVDRLSRLKRDRVKRRLKKLRRDREEARARGF